MSFQHKVLKPKTQRGKRMLQQREPKMFEDTKNALGIRTTTANENVVKILKDLVSLKKPDSTFLGRKHDLRPFENEEILDNYSSKFDAALLLTGSHNKKRPNCITFVRSFDSHVLDIYEFCVENFHSISDFPGMSPPVGNKPLLIFRGEAFEHDPVYQKMKLLFIDYFRGPLVEKIRPGGITHCISFFASEGKIFMRTFVSNSSTDDNTESKPTKANWIQVGPSMDLIPGRSRIPSDDLWKTACRVPKEATIKKRKNISQDVFGSTLGRIHMETQDFTRLNVKKMKGLREKPAAKEKDTAGSSQISSPSEYADIGGDVD